MDSIINRKEIATGVHFSHITDSRYKVNRITISFSAQLCENAAANALVARLLAATNQTYPERKAFSQKQASLYSSRIGYGVSSIGDTQMINLHAAAIDDKFALEGENITDQITDLLLECVLNPVFSEDELEQERRALIDTIEADLNEKRVYARNQATSVLYEGEPAALRSLGTIENVKAVTLDDIKKAYKNLLETAPIEVICVGFNDFAKTRTIFAEKLGSIARANIEKCSTAYSKLRKEPHKKIEAMPVTQSKLVIGYKTSSHNYAAITMMSLIFGGTTTSKLFTNVREKMSLCYYCWAQLNREKGAMLVDSGVETVNVEKAQQAIIDQLEAVRNGDFTEEDMKTARLTIANGRKGIGDSPRGVASWYLTQIYRGKIRTPEETLGDYDNVTREDIIAEAKAMQLDTIYVLEGNGGEN